MLICELPSRASAWCTVKRGTMHGHLRSSISYNSEGIWGWRNRIIEWSKLEWTSKSHLVQPLKYSSTLGKTGRVSVKACGVIARFCSIIWQLDLCLISRSSLDPAFSHWRLMLSFECSVPFQISSYPLVCAQPASVILIYDIFMSPYKK